MKSYTDIKQSKKLAKILPIESADMWWAERYAVRIVDNEYIVEKKPVHYPCLVKPSEGNYSLDAIKGIPCWSLAALIDAIPQDVVRLVGNTKEAFWYCDYADSNNDLHTDESADTPIDACYKLILKLHELNLL